LTSDLDHTGLLLLHAEIGVVKDTFFFLGKHRQDRVLFRSSNSKVVKDFAPVRNEADLRDATRVRNKQVTIFIQEAKGLNLIRELDLSQEDLFVGPNANDTVLVCSHDQPELDVEIAASQLTVVFARFFALNPGKGIVNF